MRRIAVFCGAKKGNRPEFADQARLLARTIIEQGHGIVYGGGQVGLMGVIADTALAAGGSVIGVIPDSLADSELAHRGTDLRIVATMHERKALMADLADAFLAIPGGFGTADELFEILTWRQLRFHDKPIGLLNTAAYFDPLLAWLDRSVQDGFLKDTTRALLQVDTEPLRMVQTLMTGPSGNQPT